MRVFLILAVLWGGFTFCEGTQPPHERVLVSVAPHRYFVKRIAGDTVDVVLLVPPDVSLHHYEPTPKQAIEASQTDLWFRMGDPFERRLLQAIQGHNSEMRVVDLREGLDLITADPRMAHCSCCNTEGCDLHYWLSPRLAKDQARVITLALSEMYPQNRAIYRDALKAFIQELDELDKDVGDLLGSLDQRMIMVSHPAYGYLARDYGLRQLSIEFAGKEPSPRQVSKILQQARKEGIRVIYTQPQHSSKGAILLGRYLGAQVVELDPYREDYMDNIREIAEEIAAQSEKKAGHS